MKLTTHYILDLEKMLLCNAFVSKLKNSKILIIGGTGLIGIYMVDFIMYLNVYHNFDINVTVTSRNKQSASRVFEDYIDNEHFNYLENDISRCSLHIDSDFDYVVFAASNTHPIQYSTQPIQTIMTNFMGIYNTLEMMKNNINARLCFLSSVEVYGVTYTTAPLSETSFGFIDSNTLRSGYPESKRLSESLLNAYSEIYNIDYTIARLCRVYGPTLREDDSKAISQFLFRAKSNEDIILKSSGSQYFSFIHVADACSAILKILIDGKSREAYNVSFEKSNINLHDLAYEIANQSNLKVIHELPNEVESKGYSVMPSAILDSTKLNQMGWKAIYNIHDGIENTLWYLLKQ